MKYSGKALARRFEQEMRALGHDVLSGELVENKRVYAARKTLDDATFLEFLRHSPIARMASGAMSHNSIQLLDAAWMNGDIERPNTIPMGEHRPTIERLRSTLRFYAAWEVHAS